MKIIFFGTPELAVPFLERLSETQEVVGVVTRADEPAGRGYELRSPSTKVYAQSKNIPVFQPTRWDDKLLSDLGGLNADLAVVVAYGKIIPPQVFTLPRQKTLNVHFSLLPQYRGAAPIQWALIRREQKTGVSIFWIDEGMDTGPVLLQKELVIPPGTDASGLTDLLVSLGIQALAESLERIRQGQGEGGAQAGEPTYAPPIKKEQGEINWNQPAEEIEALVRGLSEWPQAWGRFATGPLKGQSLKILKAESSEICPGEAGRCPPGAVPGEITGIARGKGFVIKCNQGFILPTFVQAQGRKPIPSWAFWQGARLRVGDRLDPTT